MTELATHPLLVAGQRLSPGTGWIDVEDPSTGRAWVRVPDAGPDVAAAAVAAARDAFDHGPWGRTTPAERGDVLRRLADLVEAHTDELTRLQVQENGKAIREQHAQTRALATHLRDAAAGAERLHGATIPSRSATSFCYTVHVPLGVVVALTPWNSPLSLLVWKLAPALAAGNTVVVKPSEVSPVSTLRLAELAAEAGLPDGALNVVTGRGELGAALVADPRVDKVAFTGSTEVGRLVGRAAGENLARATLELGGKSPQLVFADADLDLAVEGIVGGVFAAAGQTCIAGSRVLVEEPIHDELARRLVARAGRIRLGPPLDWDTEVGTIACRSQYDKVLAHIRAACDEGATVLAGGGPPDDPALADGLYIAPTVIGDVAPHMRIAREEVFGPVVALLPVRDEDHAVDVAHDSPYGLAAGVWTRDLSRAHRVVARLRCGTVWVNTYRRLSHTLPFGGFGDSGVGRENGPGAVEDYSEVKAVWIETDPTPSDPFDPLR